jgi:hypothetical protein
MQPMRPVMVSVVFVSALCACEQTNPASSRAAGGAVVGAPVEPSGEPQPTVDAEPATERLNVPKGTHIKKTEIHVGTPVKSAATAEADAASGLPTGKRQHLPAVQ